MNTQLYPFILIFKLKNLAFNPLLSVIRWIQYRFPFSITQISYYTILCLSIRNLCFKVSALDDNLY